MPALIDHDARRHEIARAVWRVVARDGASAVSIRDVAAEAGLAVGSVRHVFTTKAELLQYSMQLVHEVVSQRMTGHGDGANADPLTWCTALLSEVLPLDDQRRVELAVNLAVIVEAPAGHGLETVAQQAHRSIAQLCTVVVEAIDRASPRKLDICYESQRLHALVDGLALHLHPALGTNAPPAPTELLRRHLDELLRGQ